MWLVIIYVATQWEHCKVISRGMLIQWLNSAWHSQGLLHRSISSTENGGWADGWEHCCVFHIPISPPSHREYFIPKKPSEGCLIWHPQPSWASLEIRWHLGEHHQGCELQSKLVREPLIWNPMGLPRESPEKNFNLCKGSHWLPWEPGQTSVQWDCLPQSNHGIIQLSFCWQHSRRQIVFSPILVSIQNNSIHITTAILYLFSVIKRRIFPTRLVKSLSIRGRHNLFIFITCSCSAWKDPLQDWIFFVGFHVEVVKT